MRVRELIIALSLAGALACTENPDPRRPTLQMMEREGFGGWIVATTRDGWALHGELISATPEYIHVLRMGPGARLVFLPTAKIVNAKVYTYVSEGGFGATGVVGTLSTISHGFWLVFTAPLWMITSGVAAAVESGHVELEYPEEPLAALSAWARFPQGIPPGIDERALLLKRAAPPPVLAPPPVRPPAVTDPLAPPSSVPPIAPPQGVQALFEEAKTAAAANDCAKVLELSGRVQLADTTFWDAVFAKEPAIRRCLGL